MATEAITLAGAGPKTTKCPEAVRAGRVVKARQFWDAAEILDTLMSDRDDDLVDAYITLCVHAGIAAADGICCARLGQHAQGRDHTDAVAFLESVDRDCARHWSIRQLSHLGSLVNE